MGQKRIGSAAPSRLRVLRPYENTVSYVWVPSEVERTGIYRSGLQLREADGVGRGKNDEMS